jgi:homoserine O-acetyltransferase
MKSQRARAAATVLFGLFSGTMLLAVAYAQSSSPSAAAADGVTSPWDQQVNKAAVQADAWFDNYKFRAGETLERLKIHYATLGTPHREAQGHIDNAVLVLHWTGADGRTLLSQTYTKALFNPGRPLDANRYYLIFPDNVGHGQIQQAERRPQSQVPEL